MRISGAYNFSQEAQGRIGQFVFLEERIERNVLAVMAKLAAFDVVRSRAEFLCFRLNLSCRNKDKFRFWVDELFDEPRTSDPIYLYFFTGDPLHNSMKGQLIHYFCSFWYNPSKHSIPFAKSSSSFKPDFAHPPNTASMPRHSVL